MDPIKYKSKTNPLLSFFAELTDDGFYAVCAQVEGYPAHEVWDDWMASREGAECIAEQLANGDIPFIHKCRKAYGAGCEHCQSETNTIVATLKNNGNEKIKLNELFPEAFPLK